MKSVLIRFSGYRIVQKILLKNVQISQYLMGIGSGGDVSTSGESAVFPLLKKVASPPYCVFDVGANNGQFLKLVTRCLGKEKFSIHCFEPGQEQFLNLLRSWDSDPRTQLNGFGLSSNTCTAQLYYNKVGSGLASLNKRKLDHFNIEFDKSESVTLTTLDLYCREKNIEHIHLLKLDVEGHEREVLEGAVEMFGNDSIDIVLFEFGGCNIDSGSFFQDFWYFFDSRNYELFRVTPSGYFYHIESYEEILEQFRTTNFIAVNSHHYYK